MAVELERTIMCEIGLGMNYRWYNGSGSCAHTRRVAVDRLAAVARKHDLTISPAWLRHCRTANQADQAESGRYGLTKTWVACSYAIQDAIHRSQGGTGSPPPNSRSGFIRGQGNLK